VPDGISLPSDLAEQFKRFFNTFKIFTAFSETWDIEFVIGKILPLLGCKPALVYEIVAIPLTAVYDLEFQCGGCRVVLPLPYTRDVTKRLMKRLNMPLNAIKTVGELPFVWVDVADLLDFYLTERRKMVIGSITLSFRNLIIEEPNLVQILLKQGSLNYFSAFRLTDGKLVYIKSERLSKATVTSAVRMFLGEEKDSFTKSLACATNLLNSIAHQLSIYTLY